MERARNNAAVTSSNRKMLAWSLTLGLLLAGPVGVYGLRQQAQAQAPVAAEPAKKAFVATATGACKLVLCSQDPRKILVLVDGKAMSVRSLEYVVTDLHNAPVVRCVMYSGPFAPTKPKLATWTVSELQIADDSQFQQLVDQHFSPEPEATGVVPLVPDADTVPLVPEEKPGPKPAAPPARNPK